MKTIFIHFNDLCKYSSVSVMSWKTQDSKFGAEFAQLLDYFSLVYLLVWQKMKQLFWKWKLDFIYRLMTYGARSLSLLSDPVVICLPLSNYSLVNTDKEAWKTWATVLPPSALRTSGQQRTLSELRRSDRNLNQCRMNLCTWTWKCKKNPHLSGLYRRV